MFVTTERRQKPQALSPGEEIRFVVPYVPPSVNHYVKHTNSGHHYVTEEGVEYKQAVRIFAGGISIRAKAYELDVKVYFGKGQRGDGDNLWKCIGDGLKEAGVIHSDAAVKRWVMELDRDWNCPRTEIIVRSY